MGSCFKPQLIATTVVLETFDRHLLEVWDETALELTPIIDEILETRGDPEIRIRDISLTAIVRERESTPRVVEAGGKTLRLQQHALRHLRGPSLHGLAEDPVRNIVGNQMCGNRKTVWTCADDGNRTSFGHVLSFLSNA